MGECSWSRWPSRAARCPRRRRQRRPRPRAELTAGCGPARPSPPAPPTPTPQEVAAEVRKRLLPDLRHNAAAVEAMAVLLDYTTNKLGAFAAPALRRDLEKMKSDMANTVIQLEEARTQYRLLEEEHGRHLEEAALQRARRDDQDRALAELQQRLAGHDELVQSKVSALRAQMEGREVEAADAVAAATRGLREEYELELDRVSRRHEQTLAAALAAARADADREAAQRAQEAARREAEVAAQLAASGAAHAALREQSRRVVDSMRSDKDARTQALAGAAASCRTRWTRCAPCSSCAATSCRSRGERTTRSASPPTSCPPRSSASAR
ncbi:hypothetical protein ONE63_004805 [Megalurothrips usitatus]|uniref:Uncharacterized protein n=1 Tax=Megalurothrips usitatus TaxID=439358 RepID=A0AAV7X0U5_9NEOP|nr:hypothetical protein ONE63_004805 [Megalurothrips usitatus]